MVDSRFLKTVVWVVSLVVVVVVAVAVVRGGDDNADELNDAAAPLLLFVLGSTPWTQTPFVPPTK